MKVPHRFYYKGVEYMPKNTVDDMLATAKEKLTAAFIDKACESYCKVCLTEGCEGNLKDCIWLNRFKKAMEEL